MRIALVALCLACADDPPDADHWTSLISDDYILAPGEERSAVATRVLEEDLLVDGIRPVAPTGTHHLVLSVPGEIENDQLFVSVLGTEELDGLCLE